MERRKPEGRRSRRKPPRSGRPDDRGSDRHRDAPGRREPTRRRSEDTARREPTRRRPEDAVRRTRRRNPAEVRRMRQKKKRMRMIPVLLILLLGVYLVHAYVDQTKRIASLRKEKAELAGAQVDLENEIKSLEYDYENRDSFEFIEKVAREKLGMVKSNEEVYVDINTRDASDLPPEDRKEDEEKPQDEDRPKQEESAEPREENTGGGE